MWFLDKKGQTNIMGLGALLMVGIMLAILAMVYGVILPLLNQSAIGTQAYTLLQQLPVIVIALAFAAIVMFAVGFIFRRGD